MPIISNFPHGGNFENPEFGYPFYKSKIMNYAYWFAYTDIDYDNAYKYFKDHGDIQTGACSAIAINGFFGRNFDWYYSNQAEFIVKTPRKGNRHGVVGVAGGIPSLTSSFVDSGVESELYKILPFQLQDGINDDGLAACYNVVPNDYGNNVTVPTVSQEIEISALMLVRYVLDNFSTATTAVNYIREHCKVYFPTGLHDINYELHMLVADYNNTYVVEFVSNETKIIDVTENAPYITNFHRYEVTLGTNNTVSTPANGDAVNDNGITEHGAGLERFNLISSRMTSTMLESDVMNLLKDLYYTRMYTTSRKVASPEWLTEYVGDTLKVNSPVSAFDTIKAQAGISYSNRDRSNPVTWQTMHSVVYNINKKTMKIRFQEMESVEINDQVEFGVEPPLRIVSWVRGSDADILNMLDAAHSGIINLQTDGGWRVGDTRVITIDSFTDAVGTVHPSQNVGLTITSFDDYNNCGCVMQFDFANCLENGVRLRADQKNSGGYDSTEVYNTVLPSLVSAFPSWLQSRLITFDVLASAGGRGGTIETVSNNKLALRAQIEAMNSTSASFPGEGVAIDYYKTAGNRIKTLGINGSATDWWLRSAQDNTILYTAIKSDGSARTNAYPTTAIGLAPFGCL